MPSRRAAAAHAARRATRSRGRARIGSQLELGEGLVGQCAIEKAEDPADQRAARLHHASPPGLGDAPPQNILVLPVDLRRPGQGGGRAGVVRAVQPDAPGVPRPAHRIASASCSTRSKPTCGPRTCSSSRSRWRRSCKAGRRSCSRPTRSCEEKARLLAAPEPGSRAQEPGSRAGPAGARREGQAARPHVQVQVGVPGEHVARAAHAAQQPADPVRSALPRTPTAT